MAKRLPSWPQAVVLSVAKDLLSLFSDIGA